MYTLVCSVRCVVNTLVCRVRCIVYDTLLCSVECGVYEHMWYNAVLPPEEQAAVLADRETLVHPAPCRHQHSGA